jgi:extracellular elastinolytic metalloproteinase
MHQADERRRDPRRESVAVLTTAMTLAAVLAVSAPAGSVGRVVPAGVLASRAGGDFDVRARGAVAAVPDVRTARARIELAQRLGTQGLIQSDPLTGTLRMLGRLDGYLTGRSARPAKTVAIGFVRSNLPAFGLTKADLKTFRLRRDYVDVAGVHHISWTQSKRGVPVFHNGLRASVTSDGRLLNVTGSPVHGIRVASTVPSIGSDEAIRAARTDGGAIVAAAQSSDSASLVLFPTGRGARLAWKTFTWPSTQQVNLSVVDAGTASVLYRQSLTSDATGTATAWEFYPSDLVPAGANVANPVTFPVVDGSSLNGDNAFVWADVKDNNKPDAGEEIPAVSGTDWSVAAILDTTDATQGCTTARPCTWDKNVPFSWEANMAQNAAQVMYYLNKYHDHLAGAPYGFTPAAGNFEGKDRVLGQTMDGANSGNGLPDKNHFDNANMSTLPDGTPPTMQMYLFRSAPGLALPSANGGDDAEVVYHEYTHGLSNRLVLYPDGTSGLTNQQGVSMGEGWSDWYAEDFLNNLGFKPDTAAVGDVVMGAIAFNGMLRFNPVDCPVGAPAPCGGSLDAGSGGFTYGDFGDVAGFPEVHSDGEIWLETLWQIRQNIGAVAAETLVTRAMELSPPAPSYLDMRNAIIQADLVNFAGANKAALWSVFAERGMGYFAASTSDDVNPVEDFSSPPDCATSECATVSGKVRDSVTGKAVAGIRVAVPGLNSGFASDLADSTDSAGRFSIANVPFHTYPRLSVAGAGYEPILVKNLAVTGDLALTVKVVRDWASIEGGATVGKFTPPDYGPFGCGPEEMLDLNLGTGWGSDAVGSTEGSNNAGPRKVVIKLPKAVDVKSFAVASTGACGDGPEAGVKRFKVETRTAAGGWITAFVGAAPNNGKLLNYVPKGGKVNVRLVRFTMLSNHGDPVFMDVMEFSVRGT